MGGGHAPRRRDAKGRYLSAPEPPRSRRERRRARNRTYRDLAYHPSFAFPDPPVELTPEAVVAYAIEAAARLISPAPKVSGEDNEFACDDIARALRVDLLRDLVARLPSTKRWRVSLKRSMTISDPAS